MNQLTEKRTYNMIDYMRVHNTHQEVEVIKEREQTVKEIAENLEQEKDYRDFVRKTEDNRKSGELFRKRLAPKFQPVYRSSRDGDDDEDD